MGKKVIVLLFFGCFTTLLMAQSPAKTKPGTKAPVKEKQDPVTLSARIEYVFIDGEEKGIYAGGCKVAEGRLKTGQEVQVTDDGGSAFRMKVLKIQDYEQKDEMGRAKDVKVSAGKELFLELATLDGKKLTGLKGGFNLGAGSMAESQKTGGGMVMEKLPLKCEIDGAEWRGKTFFNSCLYYQHGNAMMKVKHPFLMMAFQSAKKPDNRQLTIMIKEFKGAAEKVEKEDMEITFTGSADGTKEKTYMQSNWENGAANTRKTEFTFEITRWEQNGDEAVISGTFSGKLYGFNALKKVSNTIEPNAELVNGTFENVKVKCFSETYSEQEKQLKQK